MEESKTEKNKRGRPPGTHLKCQKCGNKYPREIMNPINQKNYCPTCFNIVLKETKLKKDLNDLLYEIADGDKQTMALLTTNIYKAVEKEEFTVAGAVNTLKYIRLVGRWEDITPTNAYFMILKYYKETRNYWLGLKRNNEAYPDEYVQTVLQRPPTKIVVNRSDINRDDKKFIEAQRTLLYGPEINLDDIEDNS